MLFRVVLGLAAYLFLVGCDSQKQKIEDKEAVYALMNSYSEAFKNKNWDSVVNLIHPQVFEYLPKKDFKVALQQSFKNDDYEMRVSGFVVDSVSSIITHQSNQYALVHMTIGFKLLFVDTANQNEISIKMCEGFREEFGKGIVECSPKSNGLEYKINDKSYAVFIAKKRKWFFLSKDEDSKEIVDKIIPQKISNELVY